MALDDVIKSFEQFSHSDSIDQLLQKDSSNPAAYQTLAKYLQKYHKYSEADAVTMAESEDMSPKKARRTVEQIKGENKMRVAQEVESNYDEIINSLPEEALAELATWHLDGKDKKYISVRKDLQSKNYDSIKQTLMGKYKDNLWQEFIASASQQTLTRLGAVYMHEQSQKFIEKNLSDETTETKDGKTKKKYTINANKVKEYVRNTIDGYQDINQKIEAYNMLAGTIYQMAKAKK